MDTSKTMLMVILALVPSFLVSIYVFGMRVILLTLVCVVASVGFEWLYNKAMRQKIERTCLMASAAIDTSGFLRNI